MAIMHLDRMDIFDHQKSNDLILYQQGIFFVSINVSINNIRFIIRKCLTLLMKFITILLGRFLIFSYKNTKLLLFSIMFEFVAPEFGMV